MKLLFSRRRHIGSWLIRMVTWSEYSHVDVIINDTQLIGAVAPDGVGIQTIEHRLSLASKAVIMELPVKSVDYAMQFLCKQKGKPYDWLGVFGIGLHRDWQKDDRWFCSELAAMAAREGGQQPFDDKFYKRITPQDLLMLNFDKVRIK